MDVVVQEQFAAPMATTVDYLTREHSWFPDDVIDRLSGEDMIEVMAPHGFIRVWSPTAWQRDQEARFFFVSAVDAGRKHIVAGPYATRREAESRVDAVQTYAADRDGRAHFMGWGTASSREPLETPLGTF